MGSCSGVRSKERGTLLTFCRTLIMDLLEPEIACDGTDGCTTAGFLSVCGEETVEGVMGEGDTGGEGDAGEEKTAD